MSSIDHSDTDPELAAVLEHGRAIPQPDFRRRLHRRLLDRDPGYGPRPENLVWSALGYGVAGLVLMALGLLQAAAWL